MRIVVAVFVALSVATLAFAQSAPFVPLIDHAVGEIPRGTPSRILTKAGVAPAAQLVNVESGAADDLAALREWNRERRVPMRIGLKRRLAAPIIVTSVSAAQAKISSGVVVKRDASRTVLSTSLRIEGAMRTRVHLTDVRLPAGFTAWVWSDEQEPIAFGHELAAPEGDIWAPSVAGETVFLEIDSPGTSDAGVTIAEVAQVLSPEVAIPTEPAAFECMIDATCTTATNLDVVDAYRRAVAHLEFMTPEGLAVCTGGLLNDTDSTTAIPYLLTANHCFSTQSGASSLEAFWDSKSASCQGSVPITSTLERSNGATLLATSSSSDFTFVKLNSIPGGRALLGWNADPAVVPAGTALYRISHPLLTGFAPDAFPQVYSESSVDTTTSVVGCGPRPQFLYSNPSKGAVSGGSSGGPVILPGGYVVGQLFGGCGTNLSNPCDRTNLTVDGAFSATYPAISTYLSGTPATCSACTPSATVACALGNRFKLEMRWRNQFFVPVTEGVGKVIRYAENKPEVHPEYGPLSEMVYFSMFDFAPTRVELVVKMFKGIKINDMFWIFAGGMTNNEYWLKVTDTQTCKTWERYNEHGKFQIIADQTAFPLP